MQALDRRHADADRRHENEKALEGAGEVFRLAVAVGVVFVRRAGGQGEHGQSHDSAGQVDQGFEGIGQQPHRPGQPPGHPLSRMVAQAAAMESQA